MAKGFDYEDDHDWEDNVDYAARDEVYWYGKYYPREYIEALFKDSESQEKEDSSSSTYAMLAGMGILVLAGGILGVRKIMPCLKQHKMNRKNQQQERGNERKENIKMNIEKIRYKDANNCSKVVSFRKEER